MQSLMAGEEKGGGALRVRGKFGWMNNGNDGADLELYWQCHQDPNFSLIRVQGYVQLSPGT